MWEGSGSSKVAGGVLVVLERIVEGVKIKNGIARLASP